MRQPCGQTEDAAGQRLRISARASPAAAEGCDRPGNVRHGGQTPCHGALAAGGLRAPALTRPRPPRPACRRRPDPGYSSPAAASCSHKLAPPGRQCGPSSSPSRRAPESTAITISGLRRGIIPTNQELGVLAPPLVWVSPPPPLARFRFFRQNPRLPCAEAAVCRWWWQRPCRR